MSQESNLGWLCCHAPIYRINVLVWLVVLVGNVVRVLLCPDFFNERPLLQTSLMKAYLRHDKTDSCQNCV